MKTLDDLLEVVPGLRLFRSINADMLRKLLDRKPRECTWCGSHCPGKARTWCSSDCVKEFQSRCCSASAAKFVLERDKGVCQMCGRDTFASEKQAKMFGIRYWRKEDDEVLTGLGFKRGEWREVDHITPVCRYGGLCKPDQLRVLCGVCHDNETKGLRSGSKRYGYGITK